MLASESAETEFDSRNDLQCVHPQGVSTVTNVDDIETYIQSREHESDASYLSAYDLPVNERNKVMSELSYMGITAGALFPGLDGACEELRERNFVLVDASRLWMARDNRTGAEGTLRMSRRKKKPPLTLAQVSQQLRLDECLPNDSLGGFFYQVQSLNRPSEEFKITGKVRGSTVSNRASVVVHPAPHFFRMGTHERSVIDLPLPTCIEQCEFLLNLACYGVVPVLWLRDMRKNRFEEREVPQEAQRRSVGKTFESEQLTDDLVMFTAAIAEPGIERFQFFDILSCYFAKKCTVEPCLFESVKETVWVP